jgi:predicted MFS family arabinose efflux permease
MNRKIGLGWAPLILASTLGFSGTPTLPIWLAAAAERFHFTAQQSGLLASLELSCVALASIIAATRSHSSRIPLALAIALSVAGNLASFLVTSAASLTVARAVVGLSYGITLAEITRRAAQMADPHRAFAIQQLGLVVFAIVYFATSPMLMTALGPSGPFLYNMALGALALLSLVWLPSSSSGSVARTPASQAGKSSMAVGITFVAITLSFAAQTSLWANIAAAAKGSGLRLEVLTQILALGAVLNFLAPLAAVRLADHRGRGVPLLLGYLGFALSILAIALGLGPAWFAAGAIGLSFCLLFIAPFLLGTLAGLDASGKSAAAGPAFFTVGAAIGPAAGGLVIANAGFMTLGVIGAIAAACALILALAASGKIPAPSRVPA